MARIAAEMWKGAQHDMKTGAAVYERTAIEEVAAPADQRGGK